MREMVARVKRAAGAWSRRKVLRQDGFEGSTRRAKWKRVAGAWRRRGVVWEGGFEGSDLILEVPESRLLLGESLFGPLALRLGAGFCLGMVGAQVGELLFEAVRVLLHFDQLRLRGIRLGRPQG